MCALFIKIRTFKKRTRKKNSILKLNGILNRLYNCNKEEEFDNEVKKLGNKWVGMEVKYTRNVTPGQFLKYFATYITFFRKKKPELIVLNGQIIYCSQK